MKLMIAGVLAAGLAVGQPPASPPLRRIVNGNVSVRLISAPRPEMPRLAIMGRIRGTVSMSLEVAEDGRVVTVRLLSGHPFLVPAALAAAKGRVYTPPIMGGTPVTMVVPFEIHFDARFDPVPMIPLRPN